MPGSFISDTEPYIELEKPVGKALWQVKVHPDVVINLDKAPTVWVRDRDDGPLQPLEKRKTIQIGRPSPRSQRRIKKKESKRASERKSRTKMTPEKDSKARHEGNAGSGETGKPGRRNAVKQRTAT